MKNQLDTTPLSIGAMEAPPPPRPHLFIAALKGPVSGPRCGTKL